MNKFTDSANKRHAMNPTSPTRSKPSPWTANAQALFDSGRAHPARKFAISNVRADWSWRPNRTLA